MSLTETLFFRAKAELDLLLSMSEGYTEEELTLQRERFIAVYQIIEEAELEDLYQAWKSHNM